MVDASLARQTAAVEHDANCAADGGASESRPETARGSYPAGAAGSESPKPERRRTSATRWRR